jgi:hypothetical protein
MEIMARNPRGSRPGLKPCRSCVRGGKEGIRRKAPPAYWRRGLLPKIEVEIAIELA